MEGFDEDRFKWISRVALAIREMSFSNPLKYKADINEFAEGIRLMSVMSEGFIENNKSNFEDIGARADEVCLKYR